MSTFSETVIAKLIDVADTPEFPQALLDCIGHVVSLDVSMISHYSATRAITCFAGRNNPYIEDHFLKRYAAGTFRFNPFYQHHLRGLNNGVYLMKDLAATNFVARPGQESSDIRIDEREELGYLTVGWPMRVTEANIALRIGTSQTIQIAICRSGTGGFKQHELQTLARYLDVFTSLYRRFCRSEPLQTPAQRFHREIGVIDAAGLSPREREIIGLIIEGRDTEAIAAFLRIGTETVRTHRKRAYLKLNVSSRMELLTLLLPFSADWFGRHIRECAKIDQFPKTH
ncbi:helix-turn-helix transcriptional regulator (plasmid) [Agrobacterium leguminum]|uniref:HTH luxR-type domain-containing protein n=1 Tax=Agrobacterium deltaense NCPPB 1641 TaxID=1183425 RepID=A0A1S7U998_9HYPH|nr:MULTISPECIES: helix-turn-helix transcriptional regulator [Agrobacterium]WFS70099.1 helix-turn-helix transcriptional regulator [Agrobacterium leguminum]CVI63504.1 hypothetical protein AGR7A_pAt20257 [Agrobacterium deltaense NCPPB 1641]